jgi:hypothetical protein
MTERIHEYRERLLAILAKLDQMQADAEWIQAEPILQEIIVRAEDLREIHIEMQSLIAEKLSELADG